MEGTTLNRFEKKTALVAGAVAGPGRVIAQSLAKEGADIAILDFQPADKAETLVKSEGRRCTTFSRDGRDEAKGGTAVAAVELLVDDYAG